MSSQQPTGIIAWAAGIRHRMANDPGRQDLDDHILCNGFLFLEEYLEDILMGASRTEPIIELTKTPGRRKDASKKSRAATAATFKLSSPDKENIPITTSPAVKKAPSSFQKALLKASKEDQPRHDAEEALAQVLNPFQTVSWSGFRVAAENRLPREDIDDDQEEEAVKVLITPPLTRIASGVLSKEVVQPLLPSPPIARSVDTPWDTGSSPAASKEDTTRLGAELPTISEGDEADMSRASPPSSRPIRPIIRDKEISYDIPEDPRDPHGPTTTVTVSYDPDGDDDDDTQGFPMRYDRTFNDSEPTSTASSFPIDLYARDYDTHELPHVVPEPASDQNVQISPRSPPALPLTRKANVPVFPSLPVPSPLRKSTRDSSVGGPVPANARPSAAAGTTGGTRTSWLNKARDVTVKHASVVSGVKRKSGELVGDPASTTLFDGHARAIKVAKTSAEGGISVALPPKEATLAKMPPFKPVLPTKPREQPVVVYGAAPEGNSEGMMNILKRTVEGLGARVGKSMGKSLGGAAATAAAAEAKAAAEARLAQREAKGSDGNRQGRLSVSDLVGVYEGENGKGKEGESMDRRSPTSAADALPQSRTSISTTPPDSPPITRPPASLAPSAPEATTYTIPKFTVQRQPPREPSFTLPDSQPSTQSTYVSSIFDDRSVWPQSSLGTEYTVSQGLSQPTTLPQGYPPPDLSREVVLAQSQANFSALHGQPTVARDSLVAKFAQDVSYGRIPGTFDHEEDMDLGDDILNGEDMDTEEESRAAMTPSPSSDEAVSEGKPGSSQTSISTAAQRGFVAQASTLFSKVMGTSVGSALGGSKRGKAEPLKSIQLAAVAAKKQQEEAERKAARLREMEKRRAAAASRKAEVEAADKAKQQGERRKREREEDTEKKVTRATVKKVEEEVPKKRKVVVEIEKKAESKKPISKDKKELAGSRIGKPTLNSSQSQPAHGIVSKSFKQPGLPASASQSTIKLVGSSQGESRSIITMPKSGSSQTKDKTVIHVLDDVGQPTKALHAQMQARVEAQMLQARQDEPLIPSESIELPDINSEYSNSDDEDRPRTFDPPDWAQSPDLRQALESQSRMNPDDIFGPVKPLHMEELFKTKQSRFRARTSSANWAGTDELTRAEEVEYAQRMGYLD